MGQRTNTTTAQQNSYCTPHFKIYYQNSNPRNGPGGGSDRIASPKLLDAYACALEETYCHLTENWGRTCQEGVTRVDIFDLRRRLLRDTVGLTYPRGLLDQRLQIALTAAPSGTLPRGVYPFGALLTDDLRIAYSIAIHEGVHLFNLHRIPLFDPFDPRPENWGFLDEGTAHFHEWELCGARGNWLGLARDWVIHPEYGLAEDTTGCSAALLLEALCRANHPTLPGDLWKEDPLPESGLQAIHEQLLRRGALFANPHIPDFFGSNFCPDAWFGKSAPRNSMLHTVWRRYGDRSLTWSWDTDVGERNEHLGRLSSLSCQYYRVWGVRGLPALRVSVMPQPGSSIASLKTVLCQVGRNGQEVAPRVILPPEAGGSSTTLKPDHRADYLLVVVVHCGWETVEEGKPAEYRIFIQK